MQPFAWTPGPALRWCVARGHRLEAWLEEKGTERALLLAELKREGAQYLSVLEGVMTQGWTFLDHELRRANSDSGALYYRNGEPPSSSSHSRGTVEWGKRVVLTRCVLCFSSGRAGASEGFQSRVEVLRAFRAVVLGLDGRATAREDRKRRQAGGQDGGSPNSQGPSWLSSPLVLIFAGLSLLLALASWATPSLRGGRGRARYPRALGRRSVGPATASSRDAASLLRALAEAPLQAAAAGKDLLARAALRIVRTGRWVDRRVGLPLRRWTQHAVRGAPQPSPAKASAKATAKKGGPKKAPAAAVPGPAPSTAAPAGPKPAKALTRRTNAKNAAAASKAVKRTHTAAAALELSEARTEEEQQQLLPVKAVEVEATAVAGDAEGPVVQHGELWGRQSLDVGFDVGVSDAFHALCPCMQWRSGVGRRAMPLLSPS
jgi:hypothetical protein